MAETKKKVSAVADTTEKQVEPVVRTAPEPEKMVLVKIPLDRDEKEDKVVWVNERRFLIKRGVAVEVPESVALILKQEEKMLQFIIDYERNVQK